MRRMTLVLTASPFCTRVRGVRPPLYFPPMLTASASTSDPTGAVGDLDRHGTRRHAGQLAVDGGTPC